MQLYFLPVLLLASSAIAVPVPQRIDGKNPSDLHLSNWAKLSRPDATMSLEGLGIIEPRNSKTKANAEVHKARKQSMKKDVEKAAKKGATPEDKKTLKQGKITEFRNKAQTRQNELNEAGGRHRNTADLPDKNLVYTVKAGPGKPEVRKTGKDIRKAVFASHVRTNGKNSNKLFRNENVVNAKGHRQTNSPANPGRTLNALPNNLSGQRKLNEHVVTENISNKGKKKDHGKSPMRIISEELQTPDTYQFHGVTSHDQRRPQGSRGYMDHFQVLGRLSPEKNTLKGIKKLFS